MRLYVKISLLVAFISLGIGIVSILFVERIMRNSLEKEMEKKGIVITQIIAENIINKVFNNKVVLVKEYLNDVVTRTEDLEFIYVVGFNNAIFTHTFEGGFPRELLPKVHEEHKHKEVIDAVISVDRYRYKDKPILVFGYPFIEGTPAHIHIGMNQNRTFSHILTIKRQILNLTFILTLLGIVIGTGVGFYIANPLNKLAKNMRAFGEGKDMQKIVMRSTSVEVNELIHSFNHMRENLIESERALKESEAQLKELSIKDELTGLNNRRGFFTFAEHQLKTANRNKKEMGLVFIDIDGLKWINDTHGHREGDNVLIETANILKESFRELDTIARMGGDEFVALTEVSGVMAESIIRRLQENLDAHNIQKDRPYKLSLSIGIVQYDPYNPCSIDELLAMADKLMYGDKQTKQDDKG